MRRPVPRWLLRSAGRAILPTMSAPQTVAAIDWTTWQPKDRATLCFVFAGDDVLLIRKKRGLGAGKVNAPGGRLDPGETPLACAIRETQEELHVTPSDLRLCGEHRFQFVDGYSLHVHVYAATSHEGTATETDEAIPLWTPVSAIPFEEMWADDVLWIPHMLAERVFSGRWIFDGDSIVDHLLEVSAGP